MKITTAWASDSDEFPWLVAAIDEDTAEIVGTEQYNRAVARVSDVRELVIEVPDEAVRALFDVPEVKGKVTG